MIEASVCRDRPGVGPRRLPNGDTLHYFSTVFREPVVFLRLAVHGGAIFGRDKNVADRRLIAERSAVPTPS